MIAAAPDLQAYTVVTFAPVQGFISSSRKLRDLYGGSLLLSYLARAILIDAEQRLGAGCAISPALVNSSRGTPNQLVIQGNYRKGHGKDALQQAWGSLLVGCQRWLETNLADQFHFDWASAWDQCRLHSWEYFHAQGPSISAARTHLRDAKLARDWQAPNWTGESSTLSGAGAVCRPQMGAVLDPRTLSTGALNVEASRFAEALASTSLLGEAFIGKGEHLTLPELVKRLVTYPPIAEQVFRDEAASDLLPQRFKEIAESDRQVWFMADGDAVGTYLSKLNGPAGTSEAEALQRFSGAMRQWAQGLYSDVPRLMAGKATVVYAGGDDLLGALHDSSASTPAGGLSATDLFRWLQLFPNQIWSGHGQQGLTVSMGLVWTRGQVPQREALAQVRAAEQAAKRAGRNRFALRLVFRSGHHREWICPWELLPQLLTAYRDREQRQGSQALWRHLSDDLDWLAARQALKPETATSLWEAYFGDRLAPPQQHRTPSPPQSLSIHQPLAEWMAAMASVLAFLSKAS